MSRPLPYRKIRVLVTNFRAGPACFFGYGAAMIPITESISLNGHSCMRLAQ
jgi:hypothetical protein|tara:strand:+ start:433 stop:585 length:153 start_codon:yes stop_codon:yes gene_type:complete